MKNLFLSLALMLGVVAAPAAGMASYYGYNTHTNGYWETYTVTERVAYIAYETRYVCNNSSFYHGYYNGYRDCFYREVPVTKYKNQRVQKQRWVEAPRYVAPVVTRPVYNNYYQDSHSNWITYPAPTSKVITYPAPTTTVNNSYLRGYDHGYSDGSTGRYYNPYGYQL